MENQCPDASLLARSCRSLSVSCRAITAVGRSPNSRQSPPPRARAIVGSPRGNEGGSRGPVSRAFAPGVAVRSFRSAGRQTSAAHERGPDAASVGVRSPSTYQVSRAHGRPAPFSPRKPSGGQAAARPKRRCRCRCAAYAAAPHPSPLPASGEREHCE